MRKRPMSSVHEWLHMRPSKGFHHPHAPELGVSIQLTTSNVIYMLLLGLPIDIKDKPDSQSLDSDNEALQISHGFRSG